MFNNKRILILTPARLGDTLMCTPAIHLIKQACPSVKIHVIAMSELSAQTLQNNPDIERIFTASTLNNVDTSIYDQGINIHPDTEVKKHFEALKIPLISIETYTNPNIHKAEEALLFIQTLLSSPVTSIEKYYRLFPTKEDFTYIEDIFKRYEINIQKHILIGCQLGCHGVAKKKFSFIRKFNHRKVWPLKNIITLSQRLYDYNENIKFIVTGSEAEKIWGEKLEKKSPNVINFIGQTTVTQLYCLMKYMRLFISPDTGVMHTACASRVPLIALFASSYSLQRFGPYPESIDLTLIQGSSMEEITVDEVFNAVIKKIMP